MKIRLDLVKGHMEVSHQNLLRFLRVRSSQMGMAMQADLVKEKATTLIRGSVKIMKAKTTKVKATTISGDLTI